MTDRNGRSSQHRSELVFDRLSGRQFGATIGDQHFHGVATSSVDHNRSVRRGSTSHFRPARQNFGQDGPTVERQSLSLNFHCVNSSSIRATNRPNHHTSIQAARRPNASRGDAGDSCNSYMTRRPSVRFSQAVGPTSSIPATCGGHAPAASILQSVQPVNSDTGGFSYRQSIATPMPKVTPGRFGFFEAGCRLKAWVWSICRSTAADDSSFAVIQTGAGVPRSLNSGNSSPSARPLY